MSLKLLGIALYWAILATFVGAGVEQIRAWRVFEEDGSLLQPDEMAPNSDCGKSSCITLSLGRSNKLYIGLFIVKDRYQSFSLTPHNRL
jgi:hypothetical protein